ncbi:23S rRNA (adenine(2503)-C(2))-methyltransferase RlmN [Fontisphaera persica]|uniref:23S rRNA (adenine(2503)-C(2))-methyltransferase RlmN n=1 Tax=Fontisphaera persica TaxID=2974023 RepID=UPI0024BF767D|nr:23S rRNA (adenine(2503)-C(2))-methyltransferase RlmN [Fontisphaera persica]WCJ61199.1 23S rRNA (adenine(2503)-C(2))-methyltransferase RlmN [Fontisphaera persica]
MTKPTEAAAASPAPQPRALQALTREELLAAVVEVGAPAYRADQILQWLYEHRVDSWEAMSNLPRSFREQGQRLWPLRTLSPVRVQGSRDATCKFLWQLADGAFVESVLIPANPALYGDRSDRRTLCVSTQVGCAYGCKFCASGLLGWKRNLTPDEIVEQVLAVERWQARQTASDSHPPAAQGGRAVDNLVIMGMGEPLANYAHLMKALTILNAPWGGGIGARKITVSTSGLAPQIRQLAEQPLQVQLAISLHGATDEVRARIMPVNRKYPVSELMAACEYYVARKGRMITLEYILIEGVNDALSEAPKLAALARRLHAKVNLIPYNHVDGLPWKRPAQAHCEAFLKVLQQRRVTATLRREKGHDIDAACGQLRLRMERELAGAAAAPPR